MSAHESIGLDDAACTSCLICVRECPSNCITAPVSGNTPHTYLGAMRDQRVLRVGDAQQGRSLAVGRN